MNPPRCCRRKRKIARVEPGFPSSFQSNEGRQHLDPRVNNTKVNLCRSVIAQFLTDSATVGGGREHSVEDRGGREKKEKRCSAGKRSGARETEWDWRPGGWGGTEKGALKRRDESLLAATRAGCPLAQAPKNSTMAKTPVTYEAIRSTLLVWPWCVCINNQGHQATSHRTSHCSWGQPLHILIFRSASLVIRTLCTRDRSVSQRGRGS